MSSKESKLLFLRRMTWWLPALVFAIWASVLVVVAVPVAAMGVGEVLLQSFIVAAVVGVLVAGIYFGYKYMLERNPSL